MRNATLSLILGLATYFVSAQMQIASHSLIQLLNVTPENTNANYIKVFIQSPLGFKAFQVYSESNKIDFSKREDVNTHSGLWIMEDESYYQYKDQELIQRNQPVKSKSRELKRIYTYLTTLERKSEYASKIIKSLQSSQNRFVIKVSDCTHSYMVLPINEAKKGVLNNNAYAFQIMDTGEPVVDYAPWDKIGSGAEIRWNPKDKMIKVAHELSHAYDANYGLMDSRAMLLSGRVILKREVRAIYHENIIRKELNIPLRKRVDNTKTLIVAGEPYTYPLPYQARH